MLNGLSSGPSSLVMRVAATADGPDLDELIVADAEPMPARLSATHATSSNVW
ncbi:hypothetical protein [Micromonospora echinaurantiaca]|uniref:hypothetical protein n=1 Tax=Micromonospora echinaurantiaca TaxID=47857 RepID=UPI003430C6DC